MMLEYIIVVRKAVEVWQAGPLYEELADGDFIRSFDPWGEITHTIIQTQQTGS